MNRTIPVFIDEYLRKALEEYIIENDLDYKNMTIQKLSNQIIEEWLKEKNELDNRHIFYKNKASGKERLKRMTIYTSEEDRRELNRIFVRNYDGKISSMNMLVVNILEQWAIKNIKNYLERFREIERENCELIERKKEERIEVRMDPVDLNSINKYIDENREELRAAGIRSRNKLLNKIVVDWIKNNVV